MKRQDIDQKCIDSLFQYGLCGLDLNSAACFVFEQGEYLFREGDTVHNIYFVVSGKAKVYLRSSNGKQLLLSYFASRGILGHLELMAGERSYFAAVQAISEFVCVSLPLMAYAEALKSNVLFLNHIGRDLAETLYKSNINGIATALHPLEARLCAYIMQTAVGGIFRESLTEVADLLGTSYRHLLRSLNKLCEEDVLRKESRGYSVIDQKALHKRTDDLCFFQ